MSEHMIHLTWSTKRPPLTAPEKTLRNLQGMLFNKRRNSDTFQRLSCSRLMTFHMYHIPTISLKHSETSSEREMRLFRKSQGAPLLTGLCRESGSSGIVLFQR